MLFNTNYLAVMLCLSTFSSALPLDGALNPRAIAPRAKSYSIVNVDGGSTSAPPPETTTVIEEKTKTKTVEVTATAPTVTNIATATIADPTPAPAPTPPSASASSSAPTSTLTSTSQTPVSTPSSTTQPTLSSSEKPSIVTVIVTAPAGPTEYYDTGLWHTSYVIKSFAAAAVATPSSSS